MKRTFKYSLCIWSFPILIIFSFVWAYLLRPLTTSAETSPQVMVPVSIKITPEKPPKLITGVSLQLGANGTYSDGSIQDINSKVTWTVSDTKIANISDSGLVTAVMEEATPRAPGATSAPGGGAPGGAPSSDRGGGAPGGAVPGGDRGGGAPGGGAPGGAFAGGAPGGGSSRRTSVESTVTITASLAGVTSAPVSVTVVQSEGPAQYLLDGGILIRSKQDIIASKTNESAVKAINSGVMTLSDLNINSSANSTSVNNSNFYGLASAVLAEWGGKINIDNCTISTTGLGGNGAFAVGTGAVITLSDTKIIAAANGGHGIDVTFGGTIICANVDIETSGPMAAGGIATDQGGGTIIFSNGSVVSYSSPIYSTGNVYVSDSKLRSTNGPAAGIDGANNIYLTNCDLSGAERYGIFSTHTMPMAPDPAEAATVIMSGGSLRQAVGPMMFVTNGYGIFNLSNADIVTNESGVLLSAAADRWGSEGNNGGHVIFNTYNQVLNGDIICDELSTIRAALRNTSTMKGSINSDNTAKEINLILDESSIWEVTADSYITTLTISGGISGATISNIIGNGHTVYYSKSANSVLGGKTYNLAKGGKLKPR